MPHDLTDSSTFTDPVPAPADGDDDAQATFDPAFQALANRTRLLLDVALGGVTTWPETSKQIRVPLELGRAVYGDDWRENYIDPYDSAARRVLDAYSDSGRIVFPLSSVLRVGMIITSANILDRAAFARATAGDRVSIDLRKLEHNVLTPTVYASSSVATGVGSNAAGYEFTGTGTIAETVATGFEYYLIVKAGNDAATVARHDQILDVFLTVTNPGPRSL